jgi:hypothetical protein
MPLGALVLSSNMDGQFQAGGFEDSRVAEYRGSIHYMQCMPPIAAALAQESAAGCR